MSRRPSIGWVCRTAALAGLARDLRRRCHGTIELTSRKGSNLRGFRLGNHSVQPRRLKNIANQTVVPQYRLLAGNQHLCRNHE